MEFAKFLEQKRSVAATQAPAGRVVRAKLGKAGMVWSMWDLVDMTKSLYIILSNTGAAGGFYRGE